MPIIRNPKKQNKIKIDNNVVKESYEQFKALKEQAVQETQFQPQFTKDEAIWMMGLIKNCTFKGEDVQKVYEAVVKLQLIVNESK
jgi:hypothetical protein